MNPISDGSYSGSLGGRCGAEGETQRPFYYSLLVHTVADTGGETQWVAGRGVWEISLDPLLDGSGETPGDVSGRDRRIPTAVS